MRRLWRPTLAGLALWLSVLAATAQTPPAGTQPPPADTPPAPTQPAPAPAAPAGDDQLEAATNLAQRWLALVDEGKYAESWSATGKLFKANVTQDKWVQALTSGRQPLGKMVARELAGREARTEIQGAPPGNYILVAFATNFEQKSDIIETLTFVQEEDGQWQVVGYNATPKPTAEGQTPPATETPQPTPTPTPTPPPSATPEPAPTPPPPAG